MLCVKKGNNYINLPGHLKREGFFFFSFGAYCLYILLEIQKVTGGIKLHLLLIVHMCKWHDRNCTSQKLTENTYVKCGLKVIFRGFFACN